MAMAALINYWAANHKSVAHFQWDESTTFAGSWRFVATALAIYAAAIVILKIIIRSAIPLGPIQMIHNLALALTSAAIFVCCAQATFVEHEQSKWLWESSSFLNPYSWLVCFPPETQAAGRVFFWSYIYYLTKFYELVDTLIILLRKRPLTLFHVLQHAGNIIVCYSWLHYVQSLQIIFLLTNTAIQTLLYTYFFATSIGFNPPVKKMITLAQILQLAVSVIASGWLFWAVRDGRRKCCGMTACAANGVLNMVLMLLLINYYFKVYVKAKHSKAKRQSKSKSKKKA